MWYGRYIFAILPTFKTYSYASASCSVLGQEEGKEEDLLAIQDSAEKAQGPVSTCEGKNLDTHTN